MVAGPESEQVRSSPRTRGRRGESTMSEIPKDTVCAHRMPIGFGFSDRHCKHRPIVFEEDQWWCRQHSPSATRERRKARSRQVDEQIAGRQRAHERDREEHRRAECFPDLVAALVAVEWQYVAGSQNGSFCPSCWASKTLGHAPKCQLAAALAKAKELSEK